MAKGRICEWWRQDRILTENDRFRSPEIGKHKLCVRNREQFFFSCSVGHCGKVEERVLQKKGESQEAFHGYVYNSLLHDTLYKIRCLEPCGIPDRKF